MGILVGWLKKKKAKAEALLLCLSESKELKGRKQIQRIAVLFFSWLITSNPFLQVHSKRLTGFVLAMLYRHWCSKETQRYLQGHWHRLPQLCWKLIRHQLSTKALFISDISVTSRFHTGLAGRLWASVCSAHSSRGLRPNNVHRKMRIDKQIKVLISKTQVFLACPLSAGFYALYDWWKN